MEARLYPEIEADNGDMLPVGNGHRLWFETSGTPDGLPAVFLHGGPGSGCQPGHRRVFDPTRYRTVLYDQRGAGRSLPSGATGQNNPDELVADLERLRQALGVEQWVLCGGSWGVALALLYAQRHPARVAAMVLRGVFLSRPQDLEWFVGEDGAARIFPEAYRRFVAASGEPTNPVRGYRRALDDAGPEQALTAARAWSAWESAILAPTLPASEPDQVKPDPAATIARVRIAVHYAAHGFFLGQRGVLVDPTQLAGIPGIIIHGRLDLLTPAENALALQAVWPRAQLRILAHCGHTLAEPDMATAVREAMDQTADRILS
jgi:proline iminopeptidase